MKVAGGTMTTPKDIQDEIRKLGSQFMRYGCTRETVEEMGRMARTLVAMDDGERDELYRVAPQPSARRYPKSHVVEPPSAQGATTRPVEMVAPRASEQSAPVSCSCGAWAFNNPEVWGERHAKKKGGAENGHVVTLR